MQGLSCVAIDQKVMALKALFTHQISA